MIFVCDNCCFLFSRTTQPEQCPDCGKYRVRPANEKEQAEFERRLEGARYVQSPAVEHVTKPCSDKRTS